MPTDTQFNCLQSGFAFPKIYWFGYSLFNSKTKWKKHLKLNNPWRLSTLRVLFQVKVLNNSSTKLPSIAVMNTEYLQIVSEMRWHFSLSNSFFFPRFKSIRVPAKVLVIDHSDNYNKRNQLSMSTCMTMKQVKNNWIPQTPKWNFNLHPTNGPTRRSNPRWLLISMQSVCVPKSA